MRSVMRGWGWAAASGVGLALAVAMPSSIAHYLIRRWLDEA